MPNSTYRNLAFDRDALAGAGGPTIVLNAQVALKIGDAVQVHTVAQKATKTAVAADAIRFAGIAVGGGSAFGYDPALFGVEHVGLNQIAAGQNVQIQVDGIANVVAGAAIAVGATLGLDTGVAGRVLTNAVAGQMIGIALTAAAGAGATIQMLICRR